MLKHHFIIGTGRSGTNLLLTILNTSKNTLCVPEVPLLLHFLNQKSEKKTFADSDAEEVKKMMDFIKYSAIFKNDFSNLNARLSLVNTYVDFAQESLKDFDYSPKQFPAEIIFDKNPIYTFYVREILKILPDSKFLMLIRDPRGYIASSLEKPDKSRLGNHPLEFHAFVWRQYAIEMDKLTRKYPEKCMLVKYEELVDAPEETLEKICRHFDISFSENMLRYFEGNLANSDVEVNKSQEKEELLEKKYGQLKKPINKNGKDSWKTILTEEQSNGISFILRQEMSLFHYPLPRLNSDVKLFFNWRFYYYRILVKGYFVFAKKFYKLPIQWREKIRRMV